MIRIVFLSGYPYTFYGAERSLYTLVTNLDRDCINPLIVTTANGVFAQRFREANVPVHLIPAPPVLHVYGKQILQYPIRKKIRAFHELVKYNIKVSNFLRRISADIVYVNDLRALMYAGMAARLSGVPVVWYLRGDERIKFLTAFGVRIADVIITICKEMKEAFTRNELKRYSHKFKVLYTGFDFAPFTNIDIQKTREEVRKKLNIPLHAKVIGLVGSITPRKGHDLLVEAAPKITAHVPEVHFVFVGDVVDGYSEFAKMLKEKIAKLGLSSRFRWAGFREDIEKMYAALDVLVLPSRSEGLPRTVVEALAVGLPVICSDVGGTREIIGTAQDKGCIIIEKENPSQLAEAVVELINTEGLYSPSARAARQDLVLQRFSIQSYVSGFITIINDLLKAKEDKQDE